MGRAEYLYQLLTEGGEKAIDDLIADRASEDLHLDFKRAVTTPGQRTLESSDKKNLEKAISGFGNSDGGVIVWGVDCRPGRDGADIPGAKIPLPDPKHFRSLLESQVSGLTIPNHSNVISAVVASRDANGGYVVSLIPAASNMPLQVSADYKYYMRSGSNFIPILHPVLAGMFGKKPTPELIIDLVPTERAQLRDGGVMFVIGEVTLANNSAGIAEGIYMTLQFDAPEGCECAVSGAIPGDLARTQEFRGVTSVIAGDSYKIPPGASTRVFTFWLQFRQEARSDLVIKVSAGCANGPPVYREYRTKKNRLNHTMEVNIRGDATLDKYWIARRALGLEAD